MAFIRELIVSNATIPSESESTNLSFELQAEAEVAHIIVNENTYIGVDGRDRITWEYTTKNIINGFVGADIITWEYTTENIINGIVGNDIITWEYTTDNTIIGFVGDNIAWEFEPISIFRSEFPDDGEHKLIVTANVYSNKMLYKDTQEVIIDGKHELIVTENVYSNKMRYKDTQEVIIIVTILPIKTEPTDYPEYTPNYFVDIKANLNDSLIYNGTSISFKGKVVSNTDKYQVEYRLPSGSKTIDCGNINANNINNLTLGSFNPTLTITANTDGTQNGVVNITGSNILQTIKEDPTKAQILYWGNSAPIITSTSADILSSLLTKSKVKQLFANEINTLEEMYTYNVISSWIFDILPVDPVKPPEYNQFDRYAYVNNRTFPNIFYNDEYIVLETGHNYEIKIIDVNGVEQTIIPSTEIFARITHSGKAPLLI